jgi:hypothetical protein
LIIPHLAIIQMNGPELQRLTTLWPRARQGAPNTG